MVKQFAKAVFVACLTSSFAVGQTKMLPLTLTPSTLAADVAAARQADPKITVGSLAQIANAQWKSRV
jgi:hypothetical protein